MLRQSQPQLAAGTRPVDREVLQTWLQAGVETGTGIESNGLGVPQGGIISPTLSNIALNRKVRSGVHSTYGATT
jgi:retron-type reverse transcriptase